MNQGEWVVTDGRSRRAGEADGPTFPDDWFTGLSVYQDVRAAGRVVRAGQRDCWQRWRLIEPHLPQAGAILDVGANFGWFAVQIAAARPRSLVLSAEADERSARVQRRMLESYAAAGLSEAERVILLTRRLKPRWLGHLVGNGPRLAAALCLSVLHWMPEHRRFVAALGQTCDRVFIEHPHPEEVGAGERRVVDEIGFLPEYLSAHLPQFDLVLLGQTPCHRQPEWTRPLWLAVRRGLAANSPPATIHLPALLAGEPVWPPRSVWQQPHWRARVAPNPSTLGRWQSLQTRRRLSDLPETEMFSPAQLRRRVVRQRLGKLWRRVRSWRFTT